MIDLRYRNLPEHLEIDGKKYPIYTDFRIWIEFERLWREDKKLSYGIFKADRPDNHEWYIQALDFLESKNETPKSDKVSDILAFDFVRDGAYIVAGFMQAYGINLTETDYMHWHLFKALFEGLPEDTKMSSIINYRVWKPSKRKTDDIMREQKRAWTLPSKNYEEEMKRAKEAAARLYEEVNNG